MVAIGFRAHWFRIGLAMVVLAPATIAWGQYKSDEVDLSLRRQRTLVKRYTTSPATEQSKKQLFEDFITKYYIPKMTQSEPMALGELGSDRYELFRQIVWPADPSVQAWLTSTLQQRMQAIYQDSAYHPSVRYNALLVIGMLDDEYGIDSVANRRPPKPSVAANKFLVGVLAKGYRDASVPPAMIVGALVGLERHAKYRESLPQDVQNTMAKGFMAIAQTEKFPQEMNRSARNWIRIQAASGLVEFGLVGDTGQYHQVLTKLIDDPTLNVEDRCQVAGLIARLPYKEGDPIDGPATLKTLTQLAVDYGADEAKIARKFIDLQIGVSGNFANTPGGEMDGFRVQNGRVLYERRRPVGYLSDVQAALKAIEPAVSEDQKAVIQSLQQAIAPVMNLGTDANSSDLELAQAIQTMAQEFNRIAPTVDAKPVELEKERRTNRIF
jgi:hypothetical protein